MPFGQRVPAGTILHDEEIVLLKDFRVRAERVKVRFRADVYNAWNQTNFNNPNTTPTNSAFGRITGTAGDARNWQLSLKMLF